MLFNVKIANSKKRRWSNPIVVRFSKTTFIIREKNLKDQHKNIYSLYGFHNASHNICTPLPMPSFSFLSPQKRDRPHTRSTHHRRSGKHWFPIVRAIEAIASPEGPNRNNINGKKTRQRLANSTKNTTIPCVTMCCG